MSVNCSEDLPYSKDYFSDISIVELVIFILCCVITAVTFGLLIDKILYELRKVQKTEPLDNDVEISTHYGSDKNTKVANSAEQSSGKSEERERRRAKQIVRRNIQFVVLFWVVSVSSLLAIVVPRAHYVSDFLVTIYLTVCMYNLTSLAAHYYIDKDVLFSGDQSLSLRAPPVCCCLCCLPTVKVTKTVMRRIKQLIFQYVVLGPLFSLLTLILWLDNHYEEGEFKVDNTFPYLSALKTTSAMLGIYGLFLAMKVCFVHLTLAQKARFVLLKVTLLLYHLQPLIFVILEGQDIPQCRGQLSSKVRGQVIAKMLLVWEMPILGLIARFVHRRH